MANRLWVFPALLCVFISLAFSEGLNALGFVLCMLWFIRILFLKHKGLSILSLGIGAIFAMTLFAQLSINQTNLNADENKLIFYPKATSIKINGDQLRMEGKVYSDEKEENLILTYYFKTKEEKEAWQKNTPIDYLAISGELAEPAEHSNFYQFNYRKYLKRNNIHWQFKAETIEPTISSNLKKPRFHLIETMRYQIFQYINRVFTQKIGSYLRLLFFADKREFSEEALQQYRAIGVIHLFSISGFHISYLARLLRKWLLRLGITHEHTNLLLIILLPLYGLLAGFGVSVFRAVCQNVLITLGKVKNKPIDTIDAWSLTMLIALFLNPYIIFQIAFQLSYLLSGLFILLGKQKWISKLHPISSSILLSCLSFIGSIPILTYHFFEVSWVTIGANLLFIPFFTYVFFPSLLALFFCSFIFSSTPFFMGLQNSFTLLIDLVEQPLTTLNQTFDFSLVTGRLPKLVFLLLILAVFTIIKRVESRKRLSFISLVSLGFSLFYYQITPVGYVLMLDVGQGEAIVVRDPKSKKITLIDTGGQVQWGEKEEWQIREQPFSIGKDVVVPAVKAFGVSEIDRLYLTHADVDHSGEIKTIGEQIEIKEVAGSFETLTDSFVLKQLEALTETKALFIETSQAIDLPTQQSVVILPMDESESKNNQSLVLYVTIGEDIWLLTGDIEKEAEQQLIRNYPNLKANYLKVAHHGSQTSSTEEFIQQIQPKEAWISAGKNNTYGHPNKKVLERLEEYGVHVYTTKEQGALIKRYIRLPLFNTWQTDFKSVHRN